MQLLVWEEIRMAVNSEVVKQMIGLARTIVKSYDKEEALKILDNLDVWVDSGSEPRPYHLRQIVSELKGNKEPVKVDYDKDVSSSLIELYAKAATHGQYAIRVLEAGISAKRGYKQLNDLAGHIYSVPEFDIAPYVEDPRWSDDWIRQLQFCERQIVSHKNFGYDLMSVFTPKHSPEVFYEVQYRLKTEEKYRISLDWLKDPHWEKSTAKDLVYLYMYHPGTDWAGYMKPWMTDLVTSEFSALSEIKDDVDCAAIADKWKNVSPVLEYVLESIAKDNRYTVPELYLQYESYRSRYGCDGDELADKLWGDSIDEIPKYHRDRNLYYHEQRPMYDADSVEQGKPVVMSNAFLNALGLMVGD